MFYKPLEIEDESNAEAGGESPASGRKTIRMAKGYWVFNADQVSGFELPELPTVDLTTRIEAAETFVAGLKLDIRHGGASAFYQPSGDFVQMPERVLFQNTETSTATEGYYGVLFHEIGHASGSSKRVGRDLTGRFGSASYAMEEIVAEWISGLLCADLGVTAQPRPDHAHYISNWLTVLRNDKGAAMAAAAKASQAVEWMWAQVERQAAGGVRQGRCAAGDCGALGGVPAP